MADRTPYHPSATHHTDGGFVSYFEATSLEEAYRRCIIQFPPEEGWSEHYVRIGDFVNGVEYKVPDEYLPPSDPDVLPLW